MTEADAKEAISARWSTAWAAAQPTVPFALGNEAATPPAAAAPFAALSFGPIVEKQLTMGPIGSRRFEARGSVIVKLFGPVDAGVNGLATLAGSVRTILASQTITAGTGEDLFTGAATSPSAKQGGWWTATLTIPFRYYDRR